MTDATNSKTARKGGRPTRAAAGLLQEAILDAAEDIFLSQGFSGASVDHIAARAGTSKQTVYTRFGSKEALFIAVSSRLLAQKFGEAGTSDLPLREQLIVAGVSILNAMLDPKMVRMHAIIIAEAARFPNLAELSDQDEVFQGRAGLMDALIAHESALNIAADQRRSAMLLLQDMILAGPLRAAALGLENLPRSAYRARAEFAVDIFLQGMVRV